MMGDLNSIPLQLYQNTVSIETIFDFKDICSIPGVKVKTDTEVGGIFYVQLSTGQVFQCSKGLYYFDTDRVDNDNNSETFNHYTNIQTIKDNKVCLQNRKLKEPTNQGITKKRCVSKYSRSPIIHRKQSD